MEEFKKRTRQQSSRSMSGRTSRTSCVWVRLIAEMRAEQVHIAALGIMALLLKANFNPAQPRLPAGGAGGGRWTDDDTLVAQAPTSPNDPNRGQRYRVDLLDHEGVGSKGRGHTIARHVGKTDAYLLTRMNTEKIPGLLFSVGLARAGTFSSLPSDNKLVSSTLAQNRKRGRQSRSRRTGRRTRHREILCYHGA